MKQKVWLLVCIGLIIITSQIHAMSENNRLIEELKQLETIFQSNDQEATHWQIQLRETINTNDLNQKVKQINQIFSNATVQIEETNHAKKFTWDGQKSPTFNETIMIVEGKNTSSTDIIYVIEVNEKTTVDEFIQKSQIYHLAETIFTNEVKKFAWTKIIVDDMIESVCFFDKIKEVLQVQEVHTMNEKDFTVFSGYTEQWDTSIPSIDNQMNIQMAARQVAGDKTIITIGTPILTTEY
ncbi:YwmB family TATA-box binding protein [Paraliobacillus salinarum]|uniref:YwmB family TATA-box binding protein n=1 Tax=Paraliobacillus salinarum TaxID=1158996 RepID=UPI0015F3626F|nr:YwmB family TATA-box binding protein [Paraliobacillus salinarum]